MKNSIKIIAIALVSFSNVVSASDLIKNNDFKNDAKNVEIKMVSYANSNLFSSEMEGLNLTSKTVSDVIASDSKIIENETYFTNGFVNYANQDLLTSELDFEISKNLIEVQIENDLKVTESKVEVLQKIAFVNYANENLINLELGSLKNTKLSVDEIVKSNNKIIENKTTLIQKESTSKIAIKKVMKY